MVRFLKFLLMSLFIFVIFSINVNAEETEANNETISGEPVIVEEADNQNTSETKEAPTEPVIEESNATDTNDMAEPLVNEPPSDNPKTGDSIFMYISMLLISLIGIIKFTKILYQE